jgi:uncharacterized protein (TIGR02757 family)
VRRPDPGGPHSSVRLRSYLERLYAGTDLEARRAADPVAIAHRYDEARDQEIAALLASCFAYGRVAAFRPVLARLCDEADRHGGPRAWVDRFDPAVHGPPLRPLVYRWNRGVDVILLLAALRRVLDGRASLEEALPREGSLPEALDGLIGALRLAAVAEARACGVEASRFAELPRGLRTFLPRPEDGSACKRWWMFLRWMIRPPTEGIDLGLWTSRQPSELLVPLDTHVLRLSRFLGLTTRKDGSLRTAREVTAALAECDPADPVRYDFALAHLGISGGCRGRRDAAICPTCALDPVCTAA